MDVETTLWVGADVDEEVAVFGEVDYVDAVYMVCRDGVGWLKGLVWPYMDGGVVAGLACCDHTTLLILLQTNQTSLMLPIMSLCLRLIIIQHHNFPSQVNNL